MRKRRSQEGMIMIAKANSDCLPYSWYRALSSMGLPSQKPKRLLESQFPLHSNEQCCTIQARTGDSSRESVEPLPVEPVTKEEVSELRQQDCKTVALGNST